MRKIFFVVFALIVSSSTFSEEVVHSYQPKEGYVASEQTAKEIAEAVLVPIYGKEKIDKQKPFKVMLKDKTWIVQGRTPAYPGRIYLGGSFTIHISKSTGEIIFVTHSK